MRYLEKRWVFTKMEISKLYVLTLRWIFCLQLAFRQVYLEPKSQGASCQFYAEVQNAFWTSDFSSMLKANHSV